MKKQDHTLENVFWYNQGDINNGGYAAIVLADEGPMGLQLLVPQLRGPDSVKSGVRNRDDKIFDERPVLRRNNGCWESREQYLERKAELELQAELSREQAKQERELEFAQRAEAAKKLAAKLEPVSA